MPLARVGYRFPVFILNPSPGQPVLRLRLGVGEPANFGLAPAFEPLGQARLRRDALIMGFIYGVMAIMLIFKATMLLVMRHLDQLLLRLGVVLVLADRLLRDGYATWLLGLDLPLRPAILGLESAILVLGAAIYVLYLSLPRDDPAALPGWKGLGLLGLGLIPLAPFPALALPSLLSGYGLWILLALTAGLRSLRMLILTVVMLAMAHRID